MTRFPTWSDRGARARALAVYLLILSAACNDETAGPTAVAETPVEPALSPAESPELAAATMDNRSSRPGIVFGTFGMRNNYLNSVHTGWMNDGPLDPGNIMSWLSGARSKGARVVFKLAKGRDDYVKNSNGTFSLTKWKDLVSRYRNHKFGPYISDGTIIGHYLIDEPHRAERWGGRAISQATLEEMARFSKNLWPDLTTIVRVAPSYLAASSVNYRYLDAGWTQYTAGKGDAAKWVAAEAATAKRKGLGLVVGMNVLDGGNGSSGIRGWKRGKWSMSGSEIRKYGTAMLSQSLACGFFNWMHDTDYYNRSEIKSAMADVSAKARSHAKASCRQ